MFENRVKYLLFIVEWIQRHILYNVILPNAIWNRKYKKDKLLLIIVNNQ